MCGRIHDDQRTAYHHPVTHTDDWSHESPSARNKSVRHTFLWFAAFIIGQGMLWGNVIGIGLILIQQHTGFIQLDPANYYVTTAPMELDIPLILLLNVATLLVTLFVLIAPSFLVSRIHPAKSMRYE